MPATIELVGGTAVGGAAAGAADAPATPTRPPPPPGTVDADVIAALFPAVDQRGVRCDIFDLTSDTAIDEGLRMFEVVRDAG